MNKIRHKEKDFVRKWKANTFCKFQNSYTLYFTLLYLAFIKNAVEGSLFPTTDYLSGEKKIYVHIRVSVPEYMSLQ